MLEGGDYCALYQATRRHISDRFLNVCTTFGVADLIEVFRSSGVQAYRLTLQRYRVGLRLYLNALLPTKDLGRDSGILVHMDIGHHTGEPLLRRE